MMLRNSLKILSGCLLLCGLAFAADPEGLINYPPNQIMGFRGLDTRSTRPTIKDSRAYDLQNVKLSSALNLRKRYGYSIINETLDDIDTDSPAVTGIFDTEYSDATSRTIAFVGSKLKYDDGTRWLTMGGSSTITAGKNNQFQCAMALDLALCTNDVDPVIKVTSAPLFHNLVVSDLTDSLTKVKTLFWFNNYLVLMNTVEAGTERPTRVRWSNVGTVETFTDDDFTDISTFAGDEIIGAAELYGDLYIFLKSSIWKMSEVGGDDVFIFKKVVNGIGAIARDSIQSVQLPNDRIAIIFLDERKKMLMYNGVAVTDIGGIIQPTLDTLNESRLQYAVSTYDGKDYILCGSLSGSTENDICFDYQVEIFEWTKFTDVNANAMAQVQESDLEIKSYFGNYDAFVYWLDNPDNNNDVDGAGGIVDSIGYISNGLGTYMQAVIDSDLTAGNYAGAILKITSGTGAGQEGVISTGITTGVVVTTAFSTTPDNTSIYEIGAIDAYYYGKPYDLGAVQREKSFLTMLLWAEEASNNAVTVSYAVDFGSTLNSEEVSLAPSGSSLWDTALWDVGTWGTTGDKIYMPKFSGFGNFVEPKFANDSIDETFHLYGFNLIGIAGDTKQ